jgi:hypothetical protein
MKKHGGSTLNASDQSFLQSDRDKEWPEAYQDHWEGGVEGEELLAGGKNESCVPFYRPTHCHTFHRF